MYSFGIRFVLCNILIICCIGLIVTLKHIFKKYLSERAQYNLWFPLLFLLAVPFLPIHFEKFSNVFSFIPHTSEIFSDGTGTIAAASQTTAANRTLNFANDFAVSVSSNAPSFLNILILFIWITGMIAMGILLLQSLFRLHKLRQSALPVQSQQVRELFEECLTEMKIKRKIPIYSTLYLKSPVTVGFLRPEIYIPLHVISDFNKTELRYMFLHELQHYRHKDTLINVFANLAGILYWFNPFVWYALKELRSEREIACDSSVLEMLDTCEYENYGNTLINFAEKISLSPFPFATGISGNMTQLKRRIINIATFRPQPLCRKIRGILTYALISCFVLGISPVLSIFAFEQDTYHFDEAGKNISSLDLSSYFGELDGSFVLYNSNSDTWSIYNEELASTRVSPNSTYKIYDALLGLEQGVISPDQSIISWDGEAYPYDEWESNHSLDSAMHNSVNWYFQTIDTAVGIDTVHLFLQDIGYGNESVGSDIKMYWTDSSLKISPLEQVQLLQKFYNNEFHFDAQNIDAVKQAIHLNSSSFGDFYGKTGTGRVDGRDVNGWFVGYIEKDDSVYYFATNIQGESAITGSRASELTLSILSDLNIWK